MHISVRSLAGHVAELDLDPSTTMAQLRAAIEAAMAVPSVSQRLIYAGVQLEDVACPAWRARQGSSGFSAALGLTDVLDGSPLTLEHHGLQKGSIINLVQRAIPAGASEVRHRPPEVGPMVAGADDVGGGAAPTVGSGTLASCLEVLTDLEALRLLRPLLQRRPALRAALLADEQVSLPWVPAAPAAMAPAAAAHEAMAAPLGAASLGSVPGVAAAAPALPQYRVGDGTFVWSNSKQRWYPGEVVNVSEITVGNIPQGSVEVAFQLGRKWIAPADVPRFLARGEQSAGRLPWAYSAGPSGVSPGRGALRP